MNVFHINFSDQGGGAEEFAYSLSHALNNSVLYVGKKYGTSSKVKVIPRAKVAWFFNFLDKVAWKVGFKRSLRSLLGIQDMGHFTFNVLKKLPDFMSADIVHLHNIHGEFFDIKAVSRIAQLKPIVWTLHDVWAITGGEGTIFDGMTRKERLSSYPLKNPILDTRKYFQNIKRSIINNNLSISLITPSEDHAYRVRHHFENNIDVSCIRYGIEQTYFNAANRRESGSSNVLILNSANKFKSSKEILDVLKTIQHEFTLHVIGAECISSDDNLNIINYGFIQDREDLGRLFSGIDIGIFFSKGETFGLLPAELAASGSLVLLNKSLPVFQEHVELYGALLYENEKDLAAQIDHALSNIEETRRKGRFSAVAIEKNLNRTETVKKYKQLYKKAKAQWNHA
jgi:glycosyltransferase involved in cell wall biosynthesis